MRVVFAKSGSNFKTAVICLSMDDLLPTDSTWAKSTLKFVRDLAWKHDKVLVYKIDLLLLWWKAMQDLLSSRKELGYFIIRLKGFHTRMNFLGCVGYIMNNIWLSNVLELVHAKNTVEKV